MQITGKVLSTEWYEESTNGYGMTPWVVRMYVVFDHDGKRRSARLDHVMRQWLGAMTEDVRKMIHDTRPETITVFSRKYENPYRMNDKRTLYTVRKGEMEAWAKRAHALLPPIPKPKVRVEPVVEQEPVVSKDGYYRDRGDGIYEFVEYKEGEKEEVLRRRPLCAVGPPPGRRS